LTIFPGHGALFCPLFTFLASYFTGLDSVNILIVKPSSLGDIIHTLPAAGLLRRRFPQADIAWVVNRAFAPILEMCGLVDRIMIFPRDALRAPSGGRVLRSFLRELRSFGADVAVDFQGLLRSGVVSFASRARRRIGFRGAREGAWMFYTERFNPRGDARHARERNDALVSAAFGIEDPSQFPVLSIPATARVKASKIRRERETERGTGGPVLAVAPAARWVTKIWPTEQFSEVLDIVASAVPELDIWVLGSTGETELCSRVISGCRRAFPLDLCGRTDLFQLTALLWEADALLCNDTGTMHLAAALGRPTIAVFGPTDPIRTGPCGTDHTVLTGGCPDAPCFRKRCPNAPSGCWQSLSTDAVATAVLEALRARDRG